MPAYRKNYKQSDPKPILAERKGAVAGQMSVTEERAIAKVVCAAIEHGNAVYVQPSRFGTVTLKVYIEGDQFAENLNPGDDWDALAEAIVEALYETGDVARMRRVFGAGAVSGPQSDEKTVSRAKTPGAGAS